MKGESGRERKGYAVLQSRRAPVSPEDSQGGGEAGRFVGIFLPASLFKSEERRGPPDPDFW